MPRPRRIYDDPAYKAARRTLLGTPCLYCGRPSTTVEHRIPAALGGGNERSNLAGACARCNYSRGGKLGNKLRKRGRRVTSNVRY